MAYVTSVEGSVDAGSSCVTTAVDMSTANFLAILVTCHNGTTVTSVQDSSSNTWVQDSNSPKLLNSQTRGYLFTCQNPTVSAAQTATGNLASSTGGYISFIGLSGRATSSAIEFNNYAAEAGATTSHSVLSTGAHTANSDVIAGIWTSNYPGGATNETWTQSAPWTLPTSGSNGDGRNHPTGGFQYINASNGTSKTVTWTSSGSYFGGAYVLCVKDAASAIPIILMGQACL